MDPGFSKQEERFRRTLRTWLRKHLPKRHDEIDGGDDLSFAGPEQIEAAKGWQRTLLEAGYVGLDWPGEYGGQNAGAVRQAIVDEEMARHRAPRLIGDVGLRRVGPTLIHCGTEAQRRRFLPKILSAEHIWCEGCFEPEAGSDLDVLEARAEIDGDFFVVSGHKAWTTTARFADWILCLVRTHVDAPGRDGISALLIDMKTPGVDVRSLVHITGQSGWGEVLFTDVRVPRENLLGELHGGWVVARTALSHERGGTASAARTQQMLTDLLRLARRRIGDGGKVSRDPVVRQKVADLQIRVEMMKLHAWKQLSDREHGRPDGAAASIDTLLTTQLSHEICVTALEFLGDYGPLLGRSPHASDGGLWSRSWMLTLGTRVGGSRAQIEKNLIAEDALGLPRT